jgi:hypothetical protein
MHYSANGQFINKESFGDCGPKIPRQSQENFTNYKKNKKIYEGFEAMTDSQIEGKVGPIGDMGGIGNQGPIGDKGERGDKGITGPIGLTGPVGVIGVIGQTGPTGLVGPVGLTGNEGPIGPVGLVGLKGPVGSSFESCFVKNEICKFYDSVNKVFNGVQSASGEANSSITINRPNFCVTDTECPNNNQ